MTRPFRGGAHAAPVDLLGRPLWHMETPAEPGAAPAEPAAAEPAEPAATAEPWAPAREDFEALMGTVQQLAAIEQQRAAAYQQPRQEEQPATLDPFDDTFGENLIRLIDSRLQPLQQVHQQIATEEAEQRARDILADLGKRDGEFDIDVARVRAERLLPQMQQRYGFGPKAAEAALEQAAKEQRAAEQRIAEQAIAKHTNQLKTLSGVPGEPGSTYQQGVQQRTMPDYRKGGTVTGRFFGPDADQAA